MSATSIRILSLILAGAASAAAAPAQRSAEELAIWNDPRFRQRFVEGYAPESEVEPRLTKDETKLMQQVLDLLAADRSAEAAELLRGDLTPASSAALDFMLARIRLEGDEVEAAAAGLRAAVDKFPRFKRAWHDLGLAYARLGDFARAVPALTRWLEFGEADPFVYGVLGFGHASLGNHLAAESAYRMANVLDPESMRWRLGLAQSFLDQRRFADAAALFETLIAEEPDRADWWMMQARAYVGLEDAKRAAENLEILHAMGSGTPETLGLLGDIYVNEGVYRLAADRYARALAAAGAKGLARALTAAKALAARGAFDETAAMLAEIERGYGAALDGTQRIEALRLHATVAVAAGADDEEARVLEEIVALDPADGRALILLGKHAGRTGQFERAEFWFERAEKIEAFEADAKLGHAQLLANDGRYAEAVPLLRRAMELKPSESVRLYLDQVERFAKARS